MFKQQVCIQAVAAAAAAVNLSQPNIAPAKKGQQQHLLLLLLVLTSNKQRVQLQTHIQHKREAKAKGKGTDRASFPFLFVQTHVLMYMESESQSQGRQPAAHGPSCEPEDMTFSTHFLILFSPFTRYSCLRLFGRAVRVCVCVSLFQKILFLLFVKRKPEKRKRRAKGVTRAAAGRRLSLSVTVRVCLSALFLSGMSCFSPLYFLSLVSLSYSSIREQRLSKGTTSETESGHTRTRSVLLSV